MANIIQGKILGHWAQDSDRGSRGPGTVQAFRLPSSFLGPSFGAGRRLPETLVSEMESAFRTDFSRVRLFDAGPGAVHQGALSFAHGDHLYFRPGIFNVESSQTLQLLGRGLTHVVQQRTGRVVNPFTPSLAWVRDQGLEAEAERMSLVVAARARSPRLPPLLTSVQPSAPPLPDRGGHLTHGLAAHVQAALAPSH